MVTILGMKQLDYEKNGRRIFGVKLSVSYQYPKNEGIGYRVAEHFIAGADVGQFKLGEALTLTFEPGYGNTQRCTGVIYK